MTKWMTYDAAGRAQCSVWADAVRCKCNRAGPPSAEFDDTDNFVA